VGGIDKLDVRIPPFTPFASRLKSLERDLHRPYAVPGFHSSRRYTHVGDLRSYGINAILHLGCKSSAAPNSKLELMDTGELGLSDILAIVERVFSFDPYTAETMRVDTAADVEGASVAQFQKATYVKYKRSASDIATLNSDAAEQHCRRVGKAEVETLYVGSRPNCFRIYNKTEECLEQYRHLRQKLGGSGCALPFERIFGFPNTALITRVERQMGSGDIPPQLSTIQQLRDNAADFNPFERLRINIRHAKLPTPEQVGLSNWLQGMQMRELVREMGMQRFRKFLNRYSRGNAARMLAQFEDFLVTDGEQVLTDADLYQIYREAVARQLAA
jgi:hypothetical protein